MKSQWKRLLLAAIISSTVFAVTWFWYYSTEKIANDHGSEKPLAYVEKTLDDIQRRPAARLLWQSISNGEPLFNGEAIRTSDRGEVRIQFSNSERYLDLEPDSLIVIKKSQGEIALDLMEGSLFVNAQSTGAGEQEGAASSLILNSATGKVNLTGSSAALTKSSGSQVDVQVLEGKASITDKDGKSQVLTSGSIGKIGSNGVHFDKKQLEIITPLPQKILYRDADDNKPISFHWKGFPPNANVVLLLGKNRKEMHEVTHSGKENAEQMAAAVPFGKYFWKLVAHDARGQVVGESPIYRGEMQTRYAPTTIAPVANALIPIPETSADLTFRWQRDDQTQEVTLEVWSDEAQKNSVTVKKIKDDDNLTLTALKEGTYYWRISAQLVDTEKPVVGKLQKVTLKSQARIESERKAARPPVVLNWSIPESQQTQYYIDKPMMGLSWNASDTKEVAQYRVKIHEENDTSALAKMVEVKGNSLQAPVARSGRYIASIEALDKEGEVLGSSQEKTISVSPLPLLKTPLFVPEQGVLQATNDGKSVLKWQPVPGAKQYELTILKDGKELKRSRYAMNSIALKNLMPGNYEVQVSAIDEHGRLSKLAAPRKLNVPDSSGIKAPTVRKIKVN